MWQAVALGQGTGRRWPWEGQGLGRPEQCFSTFFHYRPP